MIERSEKEIVRNWPKEWDTPIVSIRCAAFNHENYIANALDGFLIQETDFPFEVIVHDDASTDKTASIIKKYEQKYPNIIKPIYETENQYSKHDGSLRRIITKACKGKYFALCEGDDYWTDPLKLQTQIKWLDSHPDYTMCCSDAIIKAPDKILDWHRYEKDCDIPVKDMILGSGSFVQTATLVYRRDLLINYPDECKKCHVADYPLQLWAVLNGRVRYFSAKTAVYRFFHAGSWTTNQGKKDLKSLIENWQSELDMLDSLDIYSNKEYTLYFKEQKESVLHNALIKNKENWFPILSKIRNFSKTSITHKKIEGFFIQCNCESIANFYYFTTQRKYKIAIFSLPFIKKIYTFFYYRILRHNRSQS